MLGVGFFFVVVLRWEHFCVCFCVVFYLVLLSYLFELLE